MNKDSVLTCPVCQKPLNLGQNQYICKNKHSFDIGKGGYVNLLLNQSANTGDDKQMILARNAFLNKGYYKGIAEKLIELIKNTQKDNLNINILDAGCGEGYYLNELHNGLMGNGSYYGFDISKKAIQVAAKRNQKINWFVGNAFHIPVIDHSIDYFISMFSFYGVEEVTRVLKNDGYVILFRAGKDHLIELKSILYDELTLKESQHDFDPNLYQVEKHHLNEQVEISSNEDLEHLLLMTPHYWKTKLENKERLKSYNSLTCTINVDIYLLRKK